MSEYNLGAQINLRSTNSFESPKKVFICYTEETLFTRTKKPKFPLTEPARVTNKNSSCEGRRERTFHTRQEKNQDCCRTTWNMLK